jgi:hypothetical protein
MYRHSAFDGFTSTNVVLSNARYGRNQVVKSISADREKTERSRKFLAASNFFIAH